MDLSENLVHRAKELGKLENLEEILKLLKSHDPFFINKSSLPNNITGNADPMNLLGRNTLRYIQLLLFRSKTLIEGSLHALNKDSALTSILSVRAHFETTGCMAFLFKKMSSYYDGNIDFENLNENLKRLSLGSTTIKSPNVPKPIQVLSLIDATDWYIDKIVIKEKAPEGGKFRNFYDDLSEFCHPNYHGIASGSAILKEESAVVYHNTNQISNLEFGFFFHLDISINLFLFLYEEVFEMLKSKKILPNIE